MRLVLGSLATLAACAMASAPADPQAAVAPAASAVPATPNASAAPAANASTTDAAAQREAAKAALDKDTQHFLAEGYKPEMHGGQQIYCRRETALGSRLTQVKNCGTIEQLKLAEQKSKAGLYDAQRQEAHGPISR